MANRWFICSVISVPIPCQWALLGAKVTGIDISSESLKYARMIAEQMEISAEFIEADILDVMDKVNKKFDIVFSSVGFFVGFLILSATRRPRGIY